MRARRVVILHCLYFTYPVKYPYHPCHTRSKLIPVHRPFRRRRHVNQVPFEVRQELGVPFLGAFDRRYGVRDVREPQIVRASDDFVDDFQMHLRDIKRKCQSRIGQSVGGMW